MDPLLKIGLEIHAQILSKTKLFSRSKAIFSIDRPNQYVSLFDYAIPGTLPILNKYCVEQAIKIGLTLNCNINKLSIFERKHYFYCDLPLGYQITQQSNPILSNGYYDTVIPNKSNQKIPQYTKRILINRVQLEQDSGKSIVDISPSFTYVDYNRADIGLLEIVTEPCFNTSTEVTAFLKTLQQLLRCLNVCNGNLEEGSLRCDVNVSVHKKLSDNTYSKSNRVEIKNLNSFHNIQQAINYEYNRQKNLINKNIKIDQETRRWNPLNNKTDVMRSKETFIDYRFMRDPDLPILIITDEWINQVRSQLPELPNQKYNRILKQYNIIPEQILILLENEGGIELFETLSKKYNPTFISSFITTDFIGILNNYSKTIKSNPIPINNVIEIIEMINNNTISRLIGKNIIEKILEGDKRTPKNIVKEENLSQITDINYLNELIENILKENDDKITIYKNGNKRIMKFFMGEIMKKSNGKVNPKICSKKLKEILDSK